MKSLKTLLMLSTLCFALGACDNKKDTKDTKTPDTKGAITLTAEEKTALQSEYKEEAQKSITADNADKIADELAKEIEADK